MLFIPTVLVEGTELRGRNVLFLKYFPVNCNSIATHRRKNVLGMSTTQYLLKQMGISQSASGLFPQIYKDI